MIHCPIREPYAHETWAEAKARWHREREYVRLYLQHFLLAYERGPYG